MRYFTEIREAHCMEECFRDSKVWLRKWPVRNNATMLTAGRMFRYGGLLGLEGTTRTGGD